MAIFSYTALVDGNVLSAADVNTPLSNAANATVPVANGGTGLTSGTSGGVLYYSAAGTLASSAALTQYGPVYGGGAGATPVAMAAGTNGQSVIGNTGAAPTWVTMGGGTTDLASGDITTTSTSAVDATGVTITITKAHASTAILCGATFQHSNSGAAINRFHLLVGGTDQGQITSTMIAGEPQTLAYTTRVSGVAAGSVIVKIQWSTSAGTATLSANSTQKAHVWAHEVH